MYQVIEFEDSGDGGGLGIVRSSWVTPEKKECLWPPFKMQSKINKCLADKIVPDENWPVYPIRRIFYKTDDPIKAREKCKNAESESELLDNDENEDSAATSITYPVPPKKPRQNDLTAKHLGDIKSDIRDIKDSQNEIFKLTSSTAPPTLPEEIALPLKSTDDLNNLQNWLETENGDNKEKLIKKLSYIGGNKTPTITRRILESVLPTHWQ